MKELLECEDLLKNKRVIAAFKALCPDKWSDAWGQITYSLADVAFEMRDACMGQSLSDEWFKQCCQVPGRWRPAFTVPETWIVAATLAWEATEK